MKTTDFKWICILLIAMWLSTSAAAIVGMIVSRNLGPLILLALPALCRLRYESVNQERTQKEAPDE